MKTIQVSKQTWKLVNSCRKQYKFRNNDEVIQAFHEAFLEWIKNNKVKSVETGVR